MGTDIKRVNKTERRRTRGLPGAKSRLL